MQRFLADDPHASDERPPHGNQGSAGRQRVRGAGSRTRRNSGPAEEAVVANLPDRRARRSARFYARIVIRRRFGTHPVSRVNINSQVATVRMFVTEKCMFSVTLGKEELSMEIEAARSQFGNIALADALAAARTYAERSLSESTRRGYARDLAAFQAWCHTHAVTALPAEPQTLAAYLADLALTDRPATIGKKLAAIAVAHRDAGLESPTEHGMVKRTLAGIRREKGTAQNQKAALLVDDLRRIVAPLGASLLDRRDRALLLLGFAAALRRSELVAIRVADVRFEGEGLVLTLRRSKTNQEGRLETIAVAYGSEPMTCPVRAVRAWLAAAGRVDGALFVGLTPQGAFREAALGDRMVAHVVKRRCRAVGIDPSGVAGHSLRRGFATAAARAQKPDRMIKRHGRWKSTAMLDRYIEDGARWDDNASAGLGL